MTPQPDLRAVLKEHEEACYWDAEDMRGVSPDKTRACEAAHGIHERARRPTPRAADVVS